MTLCPELEALSATLDHEGDALMERRVAQHLAGCPRCAVRLRSLKALKAAVKAVPLPEMPAELKLSLQGLLPPERPAWSFWGELRLALSHPAAAFSVSVTLALALFLWSRSAFWTREIPAELLLAAHNQYALTLPLAPAEKIMTEMPAQMASLSGWGDGRDVY